MTMTYKELKEKHQQEVNNFPIKFAFSNEQLKKGLQDLGITKHEALGIGAGGFIRKSDRKAFFEMLGRHETERKELMKQAENIKDMFITEMHNHECGYTGDFTDAIEALGLTWEEVQADPILLKGFEQAKKQVLRSS